MGVSQTYGYVVGAPYNSDDSIMGSTSGSPYLGKISLYSPPQERKLNKGRGKLLSR